MQLEFVNLGGHWSMWREEEERSGHGERVECSSGKGLVLSLDPGTNGIFMGEPVLSLRGRRIFCSGPFGLFHVFVRQAVSHPPAVPSVLLCPPWRTWSPVRASLCPRRELRSKMDWQSDLAPPSRVLWRICPSGRLFCHATEKHEAGLAKEFVLVSSWKNKCPSAYVATYLRACLLCLSESCTISAFNRNSLFLARLSGGSWVIWLPSSLLGMLQCFSSEGSLSLVSQTERSPCSMLPKADFSVENAIFVCSLEIILQK